MGAIMETNLNTRRPCSDMSLMVDDDSMVDLGIFPNDVVVANPIARAEDGELVIAILNGKTMVRKYFNIDTKICLVPENVNYPTIELNELDDFEIVGVVRKVINSQIVLSSRA